MALIAIVLISAQIRRDRRLKSRVSRSFFNSAPVAVQKLKGFRPNRKSALVRPQAFPTDLEAGETARRPLQSDPSPMRARSTSLDSVTGMPKGPRQITLAEALRDERPVALPDGHVPPSGTGTRPLF